MLQIIKFILLQILLIVKCAHSNWLDDADQLQFIKIQNIDGHCNGRICRDFDFGSTDKIATFSIKPKVHISDDSTYDLIKPLQYEDLTFLNSSFQQFPMELFATFERLRELDMRNCSIQKLAWQNFKMANYLTILLLSHNRLTTIEKGTFSWADRLQYLFLDSNQIEQLNSESFQYLHNLRLLDLSDNLIEILPVDIFQYLITLQELNLAKNHLRVIENEIFLNNPLLFTIRLSENDLRDVGDDVFINQTKLILLDVSHNPELEKLVINIHVRNLVSVNCSLYRVNIYGETNIVDMRDNKILELYFSSPESLETLILKNNALEQIASLTGAKNLETLDISDNPKLNVLPDPWMSDALQRLDLSNTGLTTLPILQISQLPKLISLNVSNNLLRDINPINFEYLRNLKHFYIHANNWNCYNLNLIMDMLIKPNNIMYTKDIFDINYPGQYINGIACMYRIADDDDDDVQMETTTTEVAEEFISSDENLLDKLQLNDEKEIDTSESNEADAIRKELRAVVQFYEQKFDVAFQMLDDLQKRLEKFEKLNETLWNNVAIVT